MFKIKFLPARFGDAIWIEYGQAQAPHRLLIDGGTAGTRDAITAELSKIPPAERRLDLLVISHIDRDHIEGVLSLLQKEKPGFEVDDLWFNGYMHLPETPGRPVPFGALQGEKLTQRIRKLGWPWNRAFDGKAVCIPESGDLPRFTLAGGMQITLLTPTREALAELRPKWDEEVRLANLAPRRRMPANDDLTEPVSFAPPELPDVPALAETEFEADSSEANASSIALLAEFEGKRALLAADAHAGMLISAFERLSLAGRVPLDLYKISHHGSKYTTNRDLLHKVACNRYVFSTNGSIFKHPDQETLARVLTTGGDSLHLLFNYRSPRNIIWNHAALKEQYGYRATFPAADAPGIEIEL
jgi:beta-lactamase superfamily II metal-dependent hydrolase